MTSRQVEAAVSATDGNIVAHAQRWKKTLLSHRNGWLRRRRDRCSPQSQRHPAKHPAQRAIAVAISSLGTLIAYVPVYAIASGTSLTTAPWHDVALQAIVQGLLTPVISFMLYGRAITLLGASNGSAFAALAPAMTALLAIPILGEWPATIDWIAIVLISCGVYCVSGGPLPVRRAER